MGICCMTRGNYELRQELGINLQGWDGEEDGGRFQWEVACVYLCLIQVEVWQKTTKFCKTIILQLKKNINFLKKDSWSSSSQCEPNKRLNPTWKPKLPSCLNLPTSSMLHLTIDPGLWGEQDFWIPCCLSTVFVRRGSNFYPQENFID